MFIIFNKTTKQFVLAYDIALTNLWFFNHDTSNIINIIKIVIPPIYK